ncbi:MAG: putative peptidoglycan lipid flippase [Nocardioidaceae bacterium]|nr:putative peptidoglycan lipid flippase [Nocardioidaceae bacterium]
MTDQTVAKASAWMALGTIVSRLTGFLRAGLLAAVIGTQLNADLFDIANTIPNTLYILLAGGVFNVVLVPQLVRAMKNDEDGGDAYANRVITLGLLVLGAGTAVLMAGVPYVLNIVFNDQLFDAAHQAQRHDAQLLMLLCLPQVFFYGAFVLVGQILNARGRFGPMMWAPIVNNVVSCAAILAYFFAFGSSNGTHGFSTNEALLLGLGSTTAIGLQALVLVPYLRRAGFHFRPRFDFRGVGLGHTLRLGAWTLLFIVANQIAFIWISRIATKGTLDGASEKKEAAGSTVYGLGFLVSQLPHGVITVSLATAIIPTLAGLAADRRYDRFRLELGRTVRIALVIVVPAAVGLLCLGQPATAIAGAVGALGGETQPIGYTVQAFSLAMVTYTVHYLMLRGFYANEDNHTPFFIQVVIAAVNVALALALTDGVAPDRVAMMLALSYGLAYLVGSILSVSLLSRQIGNIVDREMLVFVGRLIVCSVLAAAVMLTAAWGLDTGGLDPTRASGGLPTTVFAGGLGVMAYVGAAEVFGMNQLSYLTKTLRRRG